MRRLVSAMIAIAAISGFAGSAEAQSFPSRPITMIVPFAAGGPTDVIARVIGERMGQSLGQPVVIENVTGAGGTIAAGRVARAAPDGYTLDLATWSTHVVTPVLYRLQYDVFRDFDPVVWLTQTPLLLVSRKDIPANDLKELVGWLKAKSDPVLLGSAGGTDQVAGFLLQQQTARKSRSCLIAGWRRRCRICWQAASICCSTSRPTRCRKFATAPSKATLSPPDRAALRSRQIFRRSTRRDCRACTSRRGIRCGCRRARRRRSSPSSMPPRSTRSPIPPCATVSRAIGQEVVPREQQAPEALAAYYKAETDTWWPIIKAAGIKAE